jgi:isoleucyl-tRNA synthetase
MPDLEAWVLHRLWELDQKLRLAIESHDWTGFYPALHAFCASDLSAFYFDVRKDAIYCDRPDSLRRRGSRAVLDHLHRCLATWLAPVLCFTAEEAWTARFGEDTSVHLQTFPEIPEAWRDDDLAARWERVRTIRRDVTAALELARMEKAIGSSLQAAVELPLAQEETALLTEDEWAELCIVSGVRLTSQHGERAVAVSVAPGSKCARCWRVLEEVGKQPNHPTLCARCADAVDSGLVCRKVA